MSKIYFWYKHHHHHTPISIYFRLYASKDNAYQFYKKIFYINSPFEEEFDEEEFKEKFNQIKTTRKNIK